MTIKKRVLILFAVLLSTYILLGFFVITPLAVGNSSLIGKLSRWVHHYAYESVISTLDPNNPIRETWSRNIIYWCAHSEMCVTNGAIDRLRHD